MLKARLAPISTNQTLMTAQIGGLNLIHLRRRIDSLICLLNLRKNVRLVVQSLNSPFFPPSKGAEPGRAKKLACACSERRHFFPPNRGENHILRYFLDFACGAIFRIYKQQFLHSDWLKICQFSKIQLVVYYQCCVLIG